MKSIYFTITGTQYHLGKSFFEPGMQVKLKKEPSNKYDKEAIPVKVEGLGKVGYVANSVHTVLGESMSAGKLSSFFHKKAYGTVLYVLERGIVCRLNRE